MCYSARVMLRVPQPHPERKQRVPQHYPGHKRSGRCDCAISGRPTTSPFVSPSLFHPLTSLFPLHASHSPASPLFPLDTRNRGVHPPSNMPKRSSSEFLLASAGRALQTKEEPKNRPRVAGSATTNSRERRPLRKAAPTRASEARAHAR
jgi:hypothetical protein